MNTSLNTPLNTPLKTAYLPMIQFNKLTKLTKGALLFALVATTALMASVSLSSALAQSYPDHAITLVVPNPPGGFVDTSARLISEPLARLIAQPVVVDNRPGASGNTAYQYVKNAKPDGYTLLVSYSGYHVGNPSLMDKLPGCSLFRFLRVSSNTTAAMANTITRPKNQLVMSKLNNFMQK